VWKDSETLWTDVMEKNPNSNEAYNNRGNFYRDRGEGEKAFPDYTRAIEVNPDHPDAYNNRSIVYFNRGDVANALKDNSDALRIYPRSAEANNNRGIYYLENFPDSTIYYCTKAIQLNPNFALAFHNRAIAYYKKEQHEQAIIDYKKSIDILPNFERSFQYMGLAYVKLGKYDEAINSARQALRINPKTEALTAVSYDLLQRGNGYLKENKLDSALTCYEQSAEAVAWNSDAWYNIGLVYFNMKNIPKARQYWEKTLQVNPNHKDARQRIQDIAGMQ